MGSNDPVSFELDFATSLNSFGFSIPRYEAPSSFPAWQAYAYNGATPLASALDFLGYFQHGVPLSYTLVGPNITRVVIASQNQHFAAFSGIPLDNLVLNTPDAVPEPASLILLGTGLVAVGRFRRKVRGRA